MKNLIFLILLLASSSLYSQSVSISSDGSAPDASAILDIQSSDKGVLFPRLDFYNLENGTNGLFAYILENGFNGNGTFYGFFGSSWHSVNKWGQSGSNIYYNNGYVAVGTTPTNYIPLKVQGGILFTDGATSATPGLLFYDDLTNTMCYYDNNGIKQELGVNDVTATYPQPILASTGLILVGLQRQITTIYEQPIVFPPIILGYDTTYVDFYDSRDTLAQDFILRGKLGIGQDCVNGENFGQEQIKLRENNVRFCFDDNSNDATNNNWIIEANQSTNGGLNYLAFGDFTDSTYNFVVERQNRNYAAYIKGTNFGAGTQFPQKQMHFVYPVANTIRFEQDSTDTNTPQIWDVSFDDSGIAISDVTNSDEVPVFISNGIENAVYIDANGNVGIGTNTPSRALDVNGTVRMEPQSAAPANPGKGDVYFDDNDNKMKCYDGTQWQNLW